MFNVVQNAFVVVVAAVVIVVELEAASWCERINFARLQKQFASLCL